MTAAVLLSLLAAQYVVATDSENVEFLAPISRGDWLAPIRMTREEPARAEFSLDDGASWHPATIYLRAGASERRACDPKLWNDAVLHGKIPPGGETCLWNYSFDVNLPCKEARLRLTAADDSAVLREFVADLSLPGGAFIIDYRNARKLAGGAFPGKWALAPSGVEGCDKPSIVLPVEREKVPQGKYYSYTITDADDTPLALAPKRRGWYRVYIGMEPYSTVRIWLSRDDVRYEVPNYYADSAGKGGASTHRLCQDFLVTCADLTGQTINIAPGGSRFWRDAAIRYIRLVPMSDAEVSHYQRVRDLANAKGRPFAGYLEPCTPAHYEPAGTTTLRQHIRNEMRLNQARGSTDVYMHVIRLGSKAWYQSDIVERDPMSGWSEQGDAMAIGVEEARAAGLRFLADVGMNACYFKAKPEMTDRFIREHPEYVVDTFNQHCFDYREPAIQDYVFSVVLELMTKYDVDGVNLDFSRWGHPDAYDHASLTAIVTRIHALRQTLSAERGRPITISARVDYEDPPKEGEDPPLFLGAVKAWAEAEHVDRIMVNGSKRIKPEADLRHYVAAVAGTHTKLWADMYWGTWPETNGSPERDVEVARAWAAQGLNGGIYYYMRARPIEWESVNWQMRLIDFPDVVVRLKDW